MFGQLRHLARVYLTMGEWEKALNVSEDIINNSPYQLWTKDQYAGAWYETSKLMKMR